MDNSPDQKQFELMCVVVDFGSGSKVMKIAREHGVTGGTICLGLGTIRSWLLELLAITEVRKEIVLMVAEKVVAYNTLEQLNKDLKFHKRGHGIAFSTSVKSFIGAVDGSSSASEESRGEENPMHSVVFVVVDKGKGEEVIDAARKAGARGGTVINARGSGIHEATTLFSMAIEPEKEIVMVIAKNELIEGIVTSVREKLRIDEPGNGIMFVQDINKTYGLY